jgi:hypothetical protein
MRTERLWWCLLGIVLCAADGLLTLCGQPEAYWSGDFGSINEAHPVAAWFLSIHPLAFVAAGVPYLALVMALVLWLPRPLAVLIAVIAAAGYAAAVIAWSHQLFSQPAVALVPMAFVVVVFGLLAWRAREKGRVRRGAGSAARLTHGLWTGPVGASRRSSS